jgi:hypothetical protein
MIWCRLQHNCKDCHSPLTQLQAVEQVGRFPLVPLAGFIAVALLGHLCGGVPRAHMNVRTGVCFKV